MVLKDLGGASSAPASLVAECWASTYRGAAWGLADLADRTAEAQLVREVATFVATKPSAAGLAALLAFRRLAPVEEEAFLDDAITGLRRLYSPPAWAEVGPAVPVAAWRADDPWLSSRGVFVEYADEAEQTHVLLVSARTPGGLMADAIDLYPREVLDIWGTTNSDVPMPLRPVDVDDALADIAQIMHTTDMYWPRAGEEYHSLRALAWSRCRVHFVTRDWEPAELDRAELIGSFAQLPAIQGVDPQVVTSLANLFLDFGEGYIDAHPLAWSPEHVGMFLVDWLARKAALDPGQVEALPDVLRVWVRFALGHRALEERWIVAVEEAVDEFAGDFFESFDDPSGWGPAKEITHALLARGVDLTDAASVDAGIRAYNAEQSARSVIDQG